MRPKITCGAILKKEGKILLTKRDISPYKNYWCLPGGHIEWKEKAEEAIKREVKEETSLSFKPTFFRYYNEIAPERKWHAVSLIFIGNAVGKIKIDKNEVKESKWFTKKEIKKLKIAFTNKKVLEDYFCFQNKIKKLKKLGN